VVRSGVVRRMSDLAQPGGCGTPRTAVLALLNLVLLTIGGCERGVPSSQPASSGLGPRETVARLRELRAQRRYAELRSLVVPERGPEVVTTLLAFDDFLDANRQLCAWIRDHVGLGLAETIDQSYIGDFLGIFATHVQLLDENVRGDEATVSYTVAGQLPAQRAVLRRVNRVWRYDPEGGYSPQLPQAFHELARGLDRARGELESGRLPPEQVRAAPERLAERVRTHLAAGVKLLSEARRAAEAMSRPG